MDPENHQVEYLEQPVQPHHPGRRLLYICRKWTNQSPGGDEHRFPVSLHPLHHDPRAYRCDEKFVQFIFQEQVDCQGRGSGRQ